MDESGDDDVYSPPVDTDGDGIPDFRDVDSDGDGLSDAEERDLGTSRRLVDSDGDGVSDLIEVMAGTDPTDVDESPLARGDLVVVVDVCQPPDPERFEVRVDLTMPPSSPVDVALRFDPMDPESAEFFDQALATPTGEGCAARTATGATYLAAIDGDTLCFDVVSRENRVVDRIPDEPQVFRGELILRSSTGETLWSSLLYYLVPPASYAPGGPDGDGCLSGSAQR